MHIHVIKFQHNGKRVIQKVHDYRDGVSGKLTSSIVRWIKKTIQSICIIQTANDNSFL